MTLWLAIEEMLEGRKLPMRAAAALRRFRELVVELRTKAATSGCCFTFGMGVESERL